ETRIPRFDGEEKSIVGGASETVPVKNGMMPARQPVHDQVRKKGGESREKHGQLEHDREKRRHRCPVERFSVYDHRINEPGGTELFRCKSESGKSIITSLIAIIGRKRMKRRKRERKIPWVPIKVQMSTQVGMNKPHELGRKSRCNPPTMMMKRSNHIPTFTHIETK